MDTERVDVVRVGCAIDDAQGNNGGITTEHCRGKECQQIPKAGAWGYHAHPAVGTPAPRLRQRSRLICSRVNIKAQLGSVLWVPGRGVCTRAYHQRTPVPCTYGEAVHGGTPAYQARQSPLSILGRPACHGGREREKPTQHRWTRARAKPA